MMDTMIHYSKMWLIPVLLVLIMLGCEDRLGITSPPVVTTPTVSSTSPINLSTGIAFNNKITATFSEPMDSLTITTATFTLMQGSSFVSGTVTYTASTATFSPSSNLTPNTIYIATITTMAKNVEGSAMANNYVWSFTTGAAALITLPSVSSTDPVNAASGVAINQKIAATFSVAMDASTITASTFTLQQGTTSVSGFVSYSGTTAIFAPAGNLTPNTAYSVTITTGAKDLIGNALGNNYVWNFTTGAAAAITPPSVSSTDPLNDAISVSLNQKIAATFSKTMDASTITSSTFTLKQGSTPVSGFVSYSGTTAIFAPSANLTANTVYTVTITTGAKDLAGNALASDYVWSFTTGAASVVTPPSVSSTDPVNVATGVPFNQKIAATFSKTMDASTITTATFTLMQGTTPVSGFVSYSGTTATFTPSNNLSSNTVYTATITTGAKDLAGNPLSNNYVWSFTTGAAIVITPPAVSSTDPANLATGVPLNQHVAATFSKTMDASTITTATFTLMQGTTPVSGSVTYSGTTAIFIPNSNLTASVQYTATITTGAKDLAGNALANNYVWNFTTGAAVVVTPPAVSSTDPANLATGVPLNQHVAANFSKTMDASTVTTATFTLMNGTTPVSGSVSYSGTTGIFTPTVVLTSSTKYTATITTGAKDLGGNALLSNYTWSFTTGAVVIDTPPVVNSTDPLNLATGVSLSQLVKASFSKTMDASTITTATFTLMQGTTPVSGSVNYSGTTATFTPAANLTSSTQYTATVTTGAKDLAGNALVSNYVWNFTTGAAAGPTINLGAAATFGGFGGSAGLTNQGIFTIVNGDIGTTAASTLVTGFHDTGGNVYTETPLNIGTVNGVINCAPPAPGNAAKFAIAQQALADATTAFNYLAGLPGGPDPGAGELGGLVLAPGTYTAAAGTFKITSGDLTLDAQNNPNAVWVFQMAQSLTVGKAGQPRSIILVNGAQAKNIFWQVGSAATINGAGGGTMVGTIISYSGVTFSTAGNVTLTTLNGRALSLNASVTLVNTIVNVP
jgi:hypothetical protein